MAWISFGALPCRGKKKEDLMTARVSMLLKSRASLTCYRACFLPGRAKDLSAPGKLSSNYCYANLCLMVTEIKHQVVKAQRGGTVESALTTVLSARWGKEKSLPWRAANSGLLTRSQLCWLPTAFPTGTTRQLVSVYWFRCCYSVTLPRAWDLRSSGILRSLECSLHRRFGTTCLFNFQGSRNPKDWRRDR